MEICFLCQKEKKLRKSHIIPEFMFQNLYDDNPKRFSAIEVEFNNPKKFKKKYEQKGIRKKLFCDDCEGILNKYETYAAATIYGKVSTVNLVEQNRDEEKRLSIQKFNGFDYKKFKLFLNSILYRLLLTKEPKEIENVDLVIEELRISILNDEPLEPNQYGCIIQVIRFDAETVASNFILGAYPSNEDRGLIINKLIDGFMYSFCIKPNTTLEEFFLTKNGTISILGRLMQDDPTLFKMVSQAYGVYK